MIGKFIERKWRPIWPASASSASCVSFSVPRFCSSVWKSQYDSKLKFHFELVLMLKIDAGACNSRFYE